MESLPIDSLYQVLNWMDAGDIIRLFGCSPSLTFRLPELREVQWVYHAKQTLTHSEIHWFRLHSLPVKLLVHTRIMNNNVYWLLNGEIHREDDLPAVFMADGTKCWYQYNVKHRENDLPAEIMADGTTCWYQYGEKHRGGDQPAYVGVNGTRIWYWRDEIHREYKPAVIRLHEKEEWWWMGTRTNAFDMATYSQPNTPTNNNTPTNITNFNTPLQKTQLQKTQPHCNQKQKPKQKHKKQVTHTPTFQEI